MARLAMSGVLTLALMLSIVTGGNCLTCGTTLSQRMSSCCGDACYVVTDAANERVVQGCVNGAAMLQNVGRCMGGEQYQSCYCSDANMCNMNPSYNFTLNKPLNIQCDSTTFDVHSGNVFLKNVSCNSGCSASLDSTSMVPFYSCLTPGNFDDFTGFLNNSCLSIESDIANMSTINCACTSSNNCANIITAQQLSSTRTECFVGTGNDTCTGDYCFIRWTDATTTRGCLTFNSTLQEDAVVIGYYSTATNEVYICNSSLCNEDPTTAQNATPPSLQKNPFPFCDVAPTPTSPTSLNGTTVSLVVVNGTNATDMPTTPNPMGMNGTTGGVVGINTTEPSMGSNSTVPGMDANTTMPTTGANVTLPASAINTTTTPSIGANTTMPSMNMTSSPTVIGTTTTTPSSSTNTTSPSTSNTNVPSGVPTTPAVTFGTAGTAGTSATGATDWTSGTDPTAATGVPMGTTTTGFSGGTSGTMGTSGTTTSGGNSGSSGGTGGTMGTASTWNWDSFTTSAGITPVTEGTPMAWTSGWFTAYPSLPSPTDAGSDLSNMMQSVVDELKNAYNTADDTVSQLVDQFTNYFNNMMH